MYYSMSNIEFCKNGSGEVDNIIIMTGLDMSTLGISFLVLVSNDSLQYPT